MPPVPPVTPPVSDSSPLSGRPTYSESIRTTLLHGLLIKLGVHIAKPILVQWNGASYAIAPDSTSTIIIRKLNSDLEIKILDHQTTPEFNEEFGEKNTKVIKNFETQLTAVQEGIATSRDKYIQLRAALAKLRGTITQSGTMTEYNHAFVLDGKSYSFRAYGQRNEASHPLSRQEHIQIFIHDGKQNNHYLTLYADGAKIYTSSTPDFFPATAAELDVLEACRKQLVRSLDYYKRHINPAKIKTETLAAELVKNHAELFKNFQETIQALVIKEFELSIAKRNKSVATVLTAEVNTYNEVLSSNIQLLQLAGVTAAKIEEFTKSYRSYKLAELQFNNQRITELHKLSPSLYPLHIEAAAPSTDIGSQIGNNGQHIIALHSKTSLFAAASSSYELPLSRSMRRTLTKQWFFWVLQDIKSLLNHYFSSAFIDRKFKLTVYPDGSSQLQRLENDIGNYLAIDLNGKVIDTQQELAKLRKGKSLSTNPQENYNRSVEALYMQVENAPHVRRVYPAPVINFDNLFTNISPGKSITRQMAVAAILHQIPDYINAEPKDRHSTNFFHHPERVARDLLEMSVGIPQVSTDIHFPNTIERASITVHEIPQIAPNPNRIEIIAKIGGNHTVRVYHPDGSINVPASSDRLASEIVSSRLGLARHSGPWMKFAKYGVQLGSKTFINIRVPAISSYFAQWSSEWIANWLDPYRLYPQTQVIAHPIDYFINAKRALQFTGYSAALVGTDEAINFFLNRRGLINHGILTRPISPQISKVFLQRGIPLFVMAAIGEWQLSGKDFSWSHFFETTKHLGYASALSAGVLKIATKLETSQNLLSKLRIIENIASRGKARFGLTLRGSILFTIFEMSFLAFLEERDRLQILKDAEVMLRKSLSLSLLIRNHVQYKLKSGKNVSAQELIEADMHLKQTWESYKQFMQAMNRADNHKLIFIKLNLQMNTNDDSYEKLKHNLHEHHGTFDMPEAKIAAEQWLLQQSNHAAKQPKAILPQPNNEPLNYVEKRFYEALQQKYLNDPQFMYQDQGTQMAYIQSTFATYQVTRTEIKSFFEKLAQANQNLIKGDAPVLGKPRFDSMGTDRITDYFAKEQQILDDYYSNQLFPDLNLDTIAAYPNTLDLQMNQYIEAINQETIILLNQRLQKASSR